MATRVLLLSTDEKAVHAITQILDELDVSFEHSSDAPFTLKRLGTQRFDLLIVDCDNAQTATQVFNSARASALNKAAIAIAIVEGKAGVPNAFRLGASLVLTKPVSLEQVRNTLRTGIGMTRKDGPESKSASAFATVPPPAPHPSPSPASHAAPSVPPSLPVAFSQPGAPIAPAAQSTPATSIPVASSLPPIAQMPVPPVISPVSTPAPAPPRAIENPTTPSGPLAPVSIAPVLISPASVAVPSKPVVPQVEKPAPASITSAFLTEPKISIDAILEALPKAPGTSAHSVGSSTGAAAAPALSKTESLSSILASLPETAAPKDGLSKPFHENEPAPDEVDSLIDDSAASLRASAVPAFGGLNKQPFAGLEPPRHSRLGLIVGGVVVLLAGAATAAWFLKPEFRSAVLERYGVIKEHIALWQGHSAPDAATPSPAPATPKPPTPSPEATPAIPAESATAPTGSGPTPGTGATPSAASGNDASTSSTTASSSVSTSSTAPVAPATDKSGKAPAPTPAPKEATPAHSATAPSTTKSSSASPSVPATASARKSEILEVPEDYADDQVIHRVRPVYPKQARGRKLQGTVVLEAIVDKKGKVNSLQLVTGDPVLAQAAADAVKQWRYKPYSHNGDPAEFQTRVTVDFHPAASDR